MKDCLGNPVHLNDVVITGWSHATLVPARVIGITPNRCRLLVSEPYAKDRKVYRYSEQIRKEPCETLSTEKSNLVTV